jgi:outer membrane protein OmpA-like peptidoglycan-associated protein
VSVKKHALIISTLIMLGSILLGCAASNVSREAASNVDMGKQNVNDMMNSAGNSSLSDSYQNSSQMAKGAVLGGAAGAAVGAMSTSIGFWPGLAGGLILGASYGAYFDSTTTLKDKLENRGVNIIVLGDQILIVVPSSRLFQAMTDEIRPQSYSTLQLIAQYLNQYTKMSIKVAAYTNDTGSRRVDLALSQQQANRVAKVLSADGVDTRVLYAQGYGGTHLVEKNSLDWDDSDNYRIEITTEKLPV